MNTVHINSVDLNLLVIADSLYRHRNVSKAAKELGLSQSAVSHSLSRLRDQFGDAMFVRTSKGVMPTEFARSIQAELLEVVHRTELLINRKQAFEPREAKGRITLATTDYFEAVVMPRFQPILTREAPHLQISLRPTIGELPKRDLEEGRVDFAVAGFYADLPEGFYQTKLFSDSFGCATRKDHPTIRTRLGVEEYFSTPHALITLQGDFREHRRPGKGKKRSKQEREIVYGSYSFTGLAWVLRSSDMILTAPSLLLKQYQQFFPVRLWESPVPMEGIEIRMIWHAQTHEDPLRAWFRDQLKRVCAAL